MAPPLEPLDKADREITRYLENNSTEFRELCEGWENEAGDKHFQRQRYQADNTTEKSQKFFYNMMQSIATELQKSAGGCFTMKKLPHEQRIILDMCAGPGGFLQAALTFNRGSQAIAFSLPEDNGGHRMRLPEKAPVTTQYCDVTMFAADMGVDIIPKSHPDYDKFLGRQLDENQQFGLVLCDGQVRRTQERAAYREHRETRRLFATQIALGLEHAAPRGTMIVLMHKVEIWPMLSLIYQFYQFADVKLHKPFKSHATRSSYYLIARNIQTEHPGVRALIDEMKLIWRVATFGTDEEYEETVRGDGTLATAVLERFGKTLIRLAGPVWKTQKEALEKSSFVRGA
ncbi:Putative ribosomal RNA methyltransferase FtsJ domain-containing protein [Septoria linicola]|uniref:Ribosomal RNA methyltransferase FtsJ domain-containing protein n=1 Tax=Septoria linicola TaxID=215465 RepID=A0A9Q9AUH2_9PEZI|nr:Putative ribosomal RNA methyltransferase FtsJ domain-containing protein [Septoria linicola]